MRITLSWAVIAGLSLVAAASAVCPCFARTLWVDGSSTARGEDGSEAAASKTIGGAMATARPGDTVLIRAGVYRERFRVPSGEPDRPITVRAADGARVVVSGCEKLGEWKKVSQGIWTTTLDWRPGRLLARGRAQTIAREPSEGWWRSEKAGDDWLSDAKHLGSLDLGRAKGEAYVWLQRGNVFGTFPVQSIDPAGKMTLGGVKRKGSFADGDKYYLQNRAAWIDRPGEWAVEPDGAKFKVFFRPGDEGDLEHAEAPKADRALVLVRDAGHVRIEGLEVFGGRQFGIEVHAARDVHVRRCVAYQNGGTGISLREARDSVVARNVSWRNEYGISVGYSHGVTVEQNDVGHNGVDGLLVTWKSDDVTVRRNYLHHHLLWGHPDNFQVYRGVTNLRVRENLLLAGGQSVMMEETRDGAFEGNMIVGCGAYMLIFGHQNAGHYQVRRNTLALAGYGCMSLTWEDYDVRENVFSSGHGSALYGVRGVKGYRADRNLFWNSSRAEKPMIVATDAGWLRDFDAVRRSTGQDEHSVYADPKFRNAPVAFQVLDSRRLDECTRGRWYLRDGVDGFRVGDRVEVNFDGVPRRVTAIDGRAITVEPPLAEAPIKGWLVADWGENADFRLDLRLAADSPGAKLGEGGGPVGSRIDIQAFQRGDFDGDGRRDVPELPAELAGRRAK